MLAIKRMLPFFVLILFSVSSFPNMAFSQEPISAGAEYEEIFMPELTSTSVIVDRDAELPLEPNLGPTRYLKYPPINSLSERVDRLVYGITIDVKPELDHYGYEIRRYMSHVGNVKIFDDPEFLVEQIKNTRKARVVADYWKAHVDEEIEAIDKIMGDDELIPITARTKYKQNSIGAKTFLISLKSWIDANERLLLQIYRQPELYEVLYPEILVVVPTTRRDFYNLVSVRQSKLKDIQNYQPFALVVY